MDSQHRHELEQNDLAEFLTHFSDFWNKYGNRILIALTLVFVTIAGWRFFSSRAATRHETEFSDLAFTESPQSYSGVARDSVDPIVRVLASLRGGDAYLAEARIAGADSDDPVADRDEALAGAEKLYNQALTLAPHPVYRLNALLGLASVAESKGDWQTAQGHYDAVVSAGDAQYPMLVDQARKRIDLLPTIQEPIAFAPEPEPAADAEDAAVAPDNASEATATSAQDDAAAPADSATE